MARGASSDRSFERCRANVDPEVVTYPADVHLSYDRWLTRPNECTRMGSSRLAFGFNAAFRATRELRRRGASRYLAFTDASADCALHPAPH
jgi:hypothetical protein